MDLGLKVILAPGASASEGIKNEVAEAVAQECALFAPFAQSPTKLDATTERPI